MPTPRNALPAALLAIPFLTIHVRAGAQQQPIQQPVQQPIQQVRISAGAADTRAQSTTTAIVVTRDDIVRQGDDSLVDVLKRQPGITIGGTPGKPAIRMRGLGGDYVAILLNGVPAPSGFSLETIDPELVERIEILRAPTAETGGQAVAGAINIVLRKAGKSGAAQAEVKAGASLNAGYVAPTLTAQRSGKAGPVGYTLVATVKRNDRTYSGTTTDQGSSPDLLRHTAYADHQTGDTLELGPRLDWQPDARDTVSMQGYLRWTRNDGDKRELEDVQTGEGTRFPHGSSRLHAHALRGYADLTWTRKLDAGARATAKLSGYTMTQPVDFFYRGMDMLDTLLETHHVLSSPSERELNFNGSYRRPLLKTHALALGWEIGRKRREEVRREHQADAFGQPLLDSDEAYQATVRRTAFWVQDEWDLSDAWSAYVGLRREALRTTGEGNAHLPVDVASGVWSPILQTLFKPGGEANGGDQFRFAVSRTYKAPQIAQLMPRRYTVDNGNSATNPDQQGNPNLRPELALGVDVAWEHTAGKDDMVGVSAFAKRIRDVTLYRVFQQDGVWINLPDNAGNAILRGLEFEGKTRRGALAGRFNATRTWSRLTSVAGPDNRIPDQPAWSANLGLDATVPHQPIDVGGTYTVTGGTAARQNRQFVDYGGIKRQLDLVAVVKRGQKSRLRLSVSDLLHRNTVNRSIYTGDGIDLDTTVVQRTRTVWRAVWEQGW